MRARWIWVIALIQMIAVMLLLFAATAKQPAQPAVTIPDAAPAQVVTIRYTPAEEIQPVQRPIPTIHDYEIGADTLEKYARAFWGLNTNDEKFAFAGIAVHRALCTEKDADGSLRFESATGNRFMGVITASEFAFYRDDAPASKENLALAELYINVHLTMVMTKQYTGFAFPSWALYMGWTSDHTCAVYDEIGGNEFLVKRGK